MIEGLVLCTVLGERLAISAREVDGFSEATEGLPYAGAAFTPGAIAPVNARALRCAGAALVVDAVQVHSHPEAALDVPAALATTRGPWSVVAFVECEGALWPVVSLRSLVQAPEVSS
ncbi:MAG: hypothetical protein U0228_03835 [Myxococcaceae bacterium]